jgi:hypothetical protein
MDRAMQRVKGAGALVGWSSMALLLLTACPTAARAQRMSWELESAAIALRSEATIPVLVHLAPGVAETRLMDALTEQRLPLIGQGRAGQSARVSTFVPRERAERVLRLLAAVPGVAFVERVHRLGFWNSRSAGSVQSGVQGASAGLTPIWQQGLRGRGQVVGLIDSGVDVDGCWFSAGGDGLPRTNTWSAADGYASEIDTSHSKILAYDFLFSCEQFPGEAGCERASDPNAWDDHGHGTHCSGSMVGNRSGGQNNGMAPEAKLVVQDGGSAANACSEMPGLGCPVVDLYPIFEQAYRQGVRVHNNSYGDNEEAPAPNQSNYSARSQDVDRFTWEHKDMLIVFAAGNAGTDNTDFSVSSPSTNKNGLSVGSVRTSVTSSNDDDISSFSSRGWTSDGRIKPDLLAPGCTASAASDGDVESGNCSENGGCGTSYAAPVLVGAAALARQYFSDGFYPSGARNAADALQPSAALLKAVLINGAVAVEGRDNAGQAITPIPSNEQGWGRIQLDRALTFAGGTRQLFVDDHAAGFAIAEGEAGVDTRELTYVYRGVDPAEPLKVTLVWTDYPGEVDAPVRAPQLAAEASWNPARLVNDLDLTVSTTEQSFLGNVFSAGASTPGGSADRRNNVEQVSIARPPGGDITVRVTPQRIVQAGQDFALVVTGRWQQVSSPGESPTAAEPGPGVAGAPAGGMGTAGSQPPSAAGASGLGASGTSGLAGASAPPSQPQPSSGVGGAPTVTGSAAPQASAGGGCSCGVSRAGEPAAGWLAPCAAALVLAVRRRRHRLRARIPPHSPEA